MISLVCNWTDVFTNKNAKRGTIQRKLKVLDVLFVFNRIIKNKSKTAFQDW